MSVLTQRFMIQKINDSDKKVLLEEIYEKVFSVIWKGISFDRFSELFFNDFQNSGQLYVFRQKSEIIGYLLYRTIECNIENQSYGVIRLTANILPKYLGQHLLTKIVFIEGSKFFLKCMLGFKSFVILSTCNTPSSYNAFYKRLLKVYPSPTSSPDRSIHRMLHQLKTFFKIETIPSNPFVVEYENVTIPDEIANQLAYKQDIGTKYYLSMCPNFAQGQALVTLVPLNLWSGINEILHQLIKPLFKMKFKGKPTVQAGKLKA